MLEKKGTLKFFKNGETIFKEGSYGDEMYVIKKGKVEIFRKRDDREVILANFKDRDFFGELAFLGNHPRSASARVSVDSEIYAINKDAFLDLINDNIVWNILNRLGKRIREIDDKVEGLMISDQIRKENLSTIIQRKWT